jgi:hypothetical protein
MSEKAATQSNASAQSANAEGVLLNIGFIIAYNYDMEVPKPPKKEEIRPDAPVKVIKSEPKPKEGGLKDIPVTPANYRKFEGEESSRLPRGIFWGVAGLVVLFIGGFIVAFFVVRQKVAGAITANVVTLRAGVADLQDLDPQSAAQVFSSLENGSSSVSSALGGLSFLFQGSSNAVAAFTDVAHNLGTLSTELSARCRSSL